MRLCLQLARVSSPFCAIIYKFQSDMRALASDRVLRRTRISALQAAVITIPSDDPSYMQRCICRGRKAISLRCEIHTGPKTCLLSPDTGSTLSPVTSLALPLPDVHTISGLQQALKMLVYRIAVDGD